MGGIFGGHKKDDKPEYTGLQIQTSSAQMPIPVVWGTSKLAHNVLFYSNFQAHKSKGTKGSKGGIGGGGSKDQPTMYTYTADLALGLCEGPIHGVGFVWDDRDLSSPFALDFFVLPGTYPNATDWTYFSVFYPSYPLNFPGTAVAVGASVSLGTAASIGNIQWEIYGKYAATGCNGVDADPSMVILDFLTSPQYGAGFPASLIDTTTLFGGASSVQAYCNAVGLSFSPALVSQEQASSILTRWMQILNCSAVWSGGVLRFVPYGDTSILGGTVKTTTVPLTIPPVEAFGWQIMGGTGLQTNPDGAGFTWITLTPPGGNLVVVSIQYESVFNQAFMIDAGAMGPYLVYGGDAGYYYYVGNNIFFSKADANNAIIITYTYTTSDTFVPNLTPVYSLTDADFVDDGGEDVDPITVSRVDPFTLHTILRLECTSRSNRYSPVPIEARDQSQIEIYGPRVDSGISAHEVCDELNVGPIVAQLILNRQLYIRTTFKFKLPWQFCLLDPMDIVAVTDPVLGLYAYPVRITSIEEDEKGLLSVTAEELSVGISSTPLYNTATITTPPVNRNVVVGDVNPPLIYEPPMSYSSGVSELLLGASASLPSGAADPNWGGAYVWASLDGNSYAQIGAITAATCQGFMTDSVPALVGWDTSSVLSVDVTESGVVLATMTQAAAQQGVTLCLVDAELLAYATANLTAPNKYDLTGLQRGLYGTTPTSHATGAPFAYLGTVSTLLTSPLSSGWIGVNIWLKFQSFNTFGNSVQDLSQCLPYIFNGSTPGVAHPIMVQLQSGVPTDLGPVDGTVTIGDDFGLVSQPAEFIIDLGTLIIGNPIATALLAGSPVDLGLVTSAVTVYDDFGSVANTVYQTIILGTVP